MSGPVNPSWPARIGAYPIEREVGRGGMGIVYLGRDTRLDRPVAIKVLPEGFSRDPERLARFEREARLLASLTHPNVAGIFGLEEADGQRFLVLEYVEGETLAERIARGPLPADEAAEVCQQIAAALEAAHESGVIHRDLKPANVKLTPEGSVKVLDFGLAKGAGGGSSPSDPNMSASPTMAPSAMTSAGVILGTAAYMSPEQARGRVVDRRTDIWSFGCVLFECLTARQAFAGETVSDMIALILQGEPDWKALPANLPAHLRALMERCLTKDPKRRLRDIGEARVLLEGGGSALHSGMFVAPGANESAASVPQQRRTSAAFAWALAVVSTLVAIALAANTMRRDDTAALVVRATVNMPVQPFPDRDPANMSLSPDGSQLVGAMVDSAAASMLWLRPLGEIEGHRLAGTEDGGLPFWSPDARYVAFTTQDKLKKLDLRGGSPEVLCAVTGYGRGGSWGSAGVIIFSAGAEGPLYRVSQNGGEPKVATKLDSGETGHRFPRFLPDGRHFLYASMPPQAAQYSIHIGSIDSPKSELLMKADGTPVYVEPGYLVYGRNGRLVAQRFDAGSRKLSGEAMPLVDEAKRSDFLGAPSLTAGAVGPLAYYQQLPLLTHLVWLGRNGVTGGQPSIPPGIYETLELAPDQHHAVIVRITSPSSSDLWMVDLDRNTLSRFTFGPGRVDRPVWSADGTRIAFSSDRSGRWDIYEKSASGGGAERPVVTGGALLKYPNSFTPDGKTLLFEQVGERTGWDIWQIALDGIGKPASVIATAYDEQFPALSPDGKWLAYTSNESGRGEVYIQDYPQGRIKKHVSADGGGFAWWREDGRQLEYLAGNNRVIVDLELSDGIRIGRAQLLPLRPDVLRGRPTRDLARWLAVARVGGAAQPSDVILGLNWRSELGKR